MAPFRSLSHDFEFWIHAQRLKIELRRAPFNKVKVLLLQVNLKIIASSGKLEAGLSIPG
jgi:hypothetical protein